MPPSLRDWAFGRSLLPGHCVASWPDLLAEVSGNAGACSVVAEEIFASSFAAAAYLRSQSFPVDGKVYVVGQTGIQEELDLAGIQHIGGPADGCKSVDMGPGGKLMVDPSVRAVVVGLDTNISERSLFSNPQRSVSCPHEFICDARKFVYKPCEMWRSCIP